ncbi:MAG TPA: hypothetical protein DCY75_06805, partial [Clostridiales bacterium]|nr:hypothetical protein [Clostridiales bacterium]
LQDANTVFFCATDGTGDWGGYRSLGINNGAFVLYLAEKMRVLCPDAWFLVATNPPDIPLAAVHMRFGSEKVVGLCNAPLFNEKVLCAWLGCQEEELNANAVGVNHEYWYYDIRLNGQSVYDRLREELQSYTRERIQGPFHEQFPEWGLGFINNAYLFKHCGYLPGPVGGSNRYQNLPIERSEMWKIAFRPHAEEFEKLIQATSNEEILRVTRSCAAHFPLYITDVILALNALKDKTLPLLVINQGAWKEYPAQVMLQLHCHIRDGNIIRPDVSAVPPYIKAVLSSRILQNHLLSRALANQDEAMAVQAMTLYPERLPGEDLDGFLSRHPEIEPFIPLN